MTFTYDILCEETGEVVGFRESETELSKEQIEKLRTSSGCLSENGAKVRLKKEAQKDAAIAKVQDAILTLTVDQIKAQVPGTGTEAAKAALDIVQKKVQDVIVAGDAIPVDPKGGGEVIDPVAAEETPKVV